MGWRNPLPSSPENGPDNRAIFRSIESWSDTITEYGLPATMLYGSSDPSSATGVDGDFYLNSTTKTLFGPKVAGVWPAGVALVGSPGAAGVSGPQGPQGPQGADGGTYDIDGGAPDSVYGGILPLDAGGI